VEDFLGIGVTLVRSVPFEHATQGVDIGIVATIGLQLCFVIRTVEIRFMLIDYRLCFGCELFHPNLIKKSQSFD
jgi:hypothetical protein